MKSKEKSNLEVMTTKHPKWGEFTKRLEGKEGCDFKEEEKGNPDSTTWKCKGGNDKSLARAILQKMGGFDIDKSLKYFEDHGGYCDCEILFNVNL